MMPKWLCADEVRPILPWIITGVSVAYVAYIHHKLRKQSRRNCPGECIINPAIDKDKRHVKHILKGEELEKGKKLSLCRCWRSERFPYCDGAHKHYNKGHKDNVGPLNIEWGDQQKQKH